MKKIVLASLLMACLPYLSMAQSSDDDLYFVPKKKTEKKTAITQGVNQVVPANNGNSTSYKNSKTPVVVRDASGKVRDVDEYNRRYSSKENSFNMNNDTLYIDEKPYSERGEWVNGFDGTQDDYEYAMRIVRFRNPRYAIPVSSPLYWDVVYSLPSWEWNVYDDGFYAYAFPTFSNRLWWDWRWNYPYGASWSFNFGYYSPWYSGWHSPWYSGWYSPSWSWGWNHYYGPHYWGGSYWGGGRPFVGRGWNNRGVYDNRRAEYRPNRGGYQGSRVDSRSYGTSRVNGRVVNARDNGYSVRPSRNSQTSRGEVSNSRVESRSNSTYTRPSVNRGESSYSRPSSTRSSVREGSNALNRSYNSSSRSSYQRSSSRSSDSGSRSSYSSGSSSRSSYSSGSSFSGGSSSRSSGGARRR